DRAVRLRSEGALILRRRERREELSLPDAPFGRAAEHGLARGREALPEQLGPVQQRLDDVRRLAVLRQPDHTHDHARLQTVAALDPRQPHRSAARASSKRRSPSPAAAATVASNSASSDQPEPRNASTSSSRTRYAWRRTFSRYGWSASGPAPSRIASRAS